MTTELDSNFSVSKVVIDYLENAWKTASHEQETREQTALGINLKFKEETQIGEQLNLAHQQPSLINLQSVKDFILKISVITNRGPQFPYFVQG